MCEQHAPVIDDLEECVGIWHLPERQHPPVRLLRGEDGAAAPVRRDGREERPRRDVRRRRRRAGRAGGVLKERAAVNQVEHATSVFSLFPQWMEHLSKRLEQREGDERGDGGQPRARGGADEAEGVRDCRAGHNAGRQLAVEHHVPDMVQVHGHLHLQGEVHGHDPPGVPQPVQPADVRDQLRQHGLVPPDAPVRVHV